MVRKFVLGSIALLLGLIVAERGATYWTFSCDNPVTTKERAISHAKEVGQKYFDFQELGGAKGFIDALEKDSTCCQATKSYSWEHLHYAWSVDFKMARHIAFVDMTDCGAVFRGGKMRLN